MASVWLTSPTLNTAKPVALSEGTPWSRISTGTGTTEPASEVVGVQVAGRQSDARMPVVCGGLVGLSVAPDDTEGIRRDGQIRGERPPRQVRVAVREIEAGQRHGACAAVVEFHPGLPFAGIVRRHGRIDRSDFVEPEPRECREPAADGIGGIGRRERHAARKMR